MGAAASSEASGLAAPSSATLRLHRALDAWDEALIAGALEAGGSAAALCPVDRLEQFIVFAPDVERRSGAFALTALGRFASNLLSHMVAQETGLKACRATREGAPRVLALLLAPPAARPGSSAPGSVGAPLHSRRAEGSAAWAPGPSCLLDALRLIVCAARGSEQLRRGRAAFLLPTLLRALEATAPAPRACTARDLVFWGDLLGLEFLGPLAAASAPAFAALMPAPAPRAPPLAQPLLIAAVDAGSVHTVRLLLEAGACPNAARSGPDAAGAGAGMAALHRVAGDYALSLPAPEAFEAADSAGSAGSDAAAGAGAGAGSTGGAAAAQSEEEDALTQRPTRAMLEALLHAGADPCAPAAGSHRTPLHYIATSNCASLRADPSGRLALAVRLVLAGADPGARDAAGLTPGEAAIAARPRDGARFAAGLAEAAAARGGKGAGAGAEVAAGAGAVVVVRQRQGRRQGRRQGWRQGQRLRRMPRRQQGQGQRIQRQQQERRQRRRQGRRQGRQQGQRQRRKKSNDNVLPPLFPLSLSLCQRYEWVYWLRKPPLLGAREKGGCCPWKKRPNNNETSVKIAPPPPCPHRRISGPECTPRALRSY